MKEADACISVVRIATDEEFMAMAVVPPGSTSTDALSDFFLESGGSYEFCVRPDGSVVVHTRAIRGTKGFENMQIRDFATTMVKTGLCRHPMICRANVRDVPEIYRRH